MCGIDRGKESSIHPYIQTSNHLTVIESIKVPCSVLNAICVPVNKIE